jgi:hypothetical protein
MSKTSLALISIARTALEEPGLMVEVHCIADGWVRISDIEAYGDEDVWIVTREGGGSSIYMGSDCITAVRTISPITLEPLPML